jgi:hypothetical protein
LPRIIPERLLNLGRGKKDALGKKAATAIASVKGAALVTVVDVVVAGLLSAAVAMGFVAAFGLVLLLESAGLMLLGGALSFSAQPGVRRLTGVLSGSRIEASKSDIESVDAKAATFALVGVLLFLESLALAAATA